MEKIISENKPISDIELKVINEGIKRCEKNDKIPIMKMSLVKNSKEGKRIGGHTNMLIFNWKRNEIERYEPHRIFKHNNQLNDDINNFIEDNLVDPLNEKFGYKFKFVSPTLDCPIGLQSLVKNADVEVIGKQSGYCTVFSSFYASLRLRFPNLSLKKILKATDKVLKSDPTTMKRFIVNYSRYLQNIIKEWGLTKLFNKLFNKDGSSKPVTKDSVENLKLLSDKIDKNYMKEFEKYTDGYDEDLSELLNNPELNKLNKLEEEKTKEKPKVPPRPKQHVPEKGKKKEKKKKKEKEPPKRMELDKSSIYAKYTVAMLNDIIKNNSDITKGLSSMNKGYKVNLLEKMNLDKSTLPDIPLRTKNYGIVSGQVKPYNEEEQKKFLAVNYNELHPLKSKELDAKKHKRQFDMKLKINLNEHQKKFIVNFINNYFTGGILFHSVGSGKTLTAVAFSHYYLSLFPSYNVVIISPPSLLFNFTEAMQEFGLDIRDRRYQFHTYVKFTRDYQSIVNDKTLLIIDEVHNFRTYIREGIKEIDGKDVKVPVKGALQSKVIEACQICNKVLAMTGTPFVNKLYDIENTMAMINQRDEPMAPDQFDSLIKNTDATIDYFRYKISHFDIFKTPQSKFFPEKKEIFVPIKLYEHPFFQSQYLQVVSGKNPYKHNTEEAIFKKMTQVIDQIYDDNDILISEKKLPTPKMDMWGKLGHSVLQSTQVTKDKFGNKEKHKSMSEEKKLIAFYNAPRQFGNIINGLKIKFIVNMIKKNPSFKSIVFSSFITSSINPLRRVLTQEGIKFTLITGDESAITRQQNKNKFNQIDSGINVLIISSAGTEGVSTKNVRQLFLFESLWNEAKSEQAIARAIRFKSHSDLPPEENYCNIYRLQLCVSEDDVKIVDDFNSGKFKDASALQLQTQMELIRLRNELIKKIKNQDIEMYKQRYEKEKKDYERKKPMARDSYNGKMVPIPFDASYYVDIPLIRELAKENNTGLWKKYNDLIKKIYDEKIPVFGDETILNISSKSADINLMQMSIVKETIINTFIKQLDEYVPQLESFKEPLHQQLIEAIDKEQNVEKLLKKQNEILDKIGKTIVEDASSVQQFIMASKANKLKKLSKISERMGGVEKYQEFFTPPEIVNKMLSYSNVIKKKDFIRVLEPSAGFGSIVTGIVDYRTKINDRGTYIEMVEINPPNREVLQKLFVDRDPSQFNLAKTPSFLDFPPGEKYDLIVMNPPFHLKKELNIDLDKDYWDIDFIIRAYDEFLNDGGELLATVTQYLSHGKEYAKKWIDKLKDNNKFEIVEEIRDYDWKATPEKEVKGQKSSRIRNFNFDIIRIRKPKNESNESIDIDV